MKTTLDTLRNELRKSPSLFVHFPEDLIILEVLPGGSLKLFRTLLNDLQFPLGAAKRVSKNL